MEKIFEVVKDSDCFFRPSELFTYEELEKASLRELARKGSTKTGAVQIMLEYNVEMEDIIKKTGLSEEEILKIKESMYFR